MLEAGDVVDAVVERIEHYGAYLRFDGNTILVLIPDLQWNPTRHPSEVVSIGDVVQVKIVRIPPLVGSLKALKTESNPYLPLAALPKGAAVRACVTHVYPDGSAAVALESAARGHLRASGSGRKLHVGEAVDAVIDSLDVEQGRLILRTDRKITSVFCIAW